MDRRKDSPLKDILVVLFCLSGALFSLNLFRLDLFQAIGSQDNEAIGTITIKNNNVQRRLANRVLWSRLFVESPVYMGDLIRVAELSGATLHIEGIDIDIHENTLIRISQSPDGGGSFQIELSEGSLNLASGAESGGIVLNLAGNLVKAKPGSVLSAASGENGISIQLSEGNAAISNQEGRELVLDAGGMLTLNAEGVEQREAAAVMIRPRPNARFLKNSPEPMNINFAWNRINLDADQPLRLEIAEDRSFARISYSAESINAADVNLGSGVWHWRLSLGTTALSAGQLTIADASGVKLISPAQNAVHKPGALRFEWTEAESASYYILEAGETPDFKNPRIKKETAIPSFIESNPDTGTWYWRVMPVFPSLYEGSSAYSPAASFCIEQDSELIPQTEPEPVAQPVLLLPEPENRRPVRGYRVEFKELQTNRSIEFSWSAVPGANGYIFKLYKESAGRRHELIRANPVSNTGWMLDNLSLLDQGTFVWQVEAVRVNSNGTVDRRGRPGENTFTIDIPLPGQVRIEDIGTLYGN